MNVVHVGQIAHAGSDASQHADNLENLQLGIVGAQKSVQRSILHKLGDDHDWLTLGHHALDGRGRERERESERDSESERENETAAFPGQRSRWRLSLPGFGTGSADNTGLMIRRKGGKEKPRERVKRLPKEGGRRNFVRGKQSGGGKGNESRRECALNYQMAEIYLDRQEYSHLRLLAAWGGIPCVFRRFLHID